MRSVKRTAKAPTYPAWMQPQGSDVMLDVHVAPRASRSRIMGVHDNRLKIQLAAPPTDGQANAALVQFLAKCLGVARAQIEIVGGQANCSKTVRLACVPAQRVMLALTPVNANLR